MKAIICRPGKVAEIEDIKTDLASLQAIVGGYIEIIYPTETACIVLNEEGKLNRLEACRILKNDDGSEYDVIAGTCIICGISEDGELGELSEEDTKAMLAEFGEPCPDGTEVPSPEWFISTFKW